MSTNASKLSLLAPNVNASGTVEATTIDGLDSSQFLRSDTSDTMSGDLTVSGAISAQGLLKTADGILFDEDGDFTGGNYFTITETASNYMRMGYNWGDDLVVTSGGNIGIGTSTPEYKLQINGGDVSIYGGIDGYNADQEKVRLYIGNNNANLGAMYNYGLYLDPGNGAGNAVMIRQSTGNVGIGTITPSTKLHIQGSTGQQLLIVNDNDPGINIKTTTSNVIGYLFVDTSDGNTFDVEGSNGVNINGLSGVTIGKFTTGGLDITSGTYKKGGTSILSQIGYSYNKFTTSNTQTASTTSNFVVANGSTFVYTPVRADSSIRIIGDINAGIAYSNPSGTNHGQIIYRLKVVTDVGTYYSSEVLYWSRVDTFTGIYEWTGNEICEYHLSDASHNSGAITISIEYTAVQTAGTGLSRGGINTWGGTSIIKVEEYI